MFLLAYAIFRVLQTEPLIEGELDPHVTGCHESPDQLSAPGIGVWEVWALDHSLSRHCCDLLLMGILHSWNRRRTVLWFVIYIPSLFDWCRLNPLAFGGVNRCTLWCWDINMSSILQRATMQCEILTREGFQIDARLMFYSSLDRSDTNFNMLPISQSDIKHIKPASNARMP